jgi:hypothetical protein
MFCPPANRLQTQSPTLTSSTFPDCGSIYQPFESSNESGLGLRGNTNTFANCYNGMRARKRKRLSLGEYPMRQAERAHREGRVTLAGWPPSQCAFCFHWGTLTPCHPQSSRLVTFQVMWLITTPLVI